MNKLLTAIFFVTLVSGCSPSEPPTGEPAAAAETDTTPETITVTEQNYAHAETARNFRNWVKLGANK